MFNVAQEQTADKVELGWGRIVLRQEREYLVDTVYGRIKAEKADGCLVTPQPGDQVLAAWDQDAAYILNVVKQAASQAATPIDIKGNLELKVEGDLNLNAGRINMDGDEEVKIRTSRLDLFFAKGKSVFGAFQYRGESALGWIDVLKTAARQADFTAERLMQRVVRHYRRIQDFEDSRVGRFNLMVNSLFSVKSKSASIKAKDKVKVDGDRILLG